jgi:hypothetical protein
MEVTACNSAQVVDHQEILERFASPCSSVFGVKGSDRAEYLVRYQYQAAFLL